METKIVYEVKDLLKMFPFSKAHWYREINKGNVPIVQIGTRKAVCGWYIDQQLEKPSIKNQQVILNKNVDV